MEKNADDRVFVRAQAVRITNKVLKVSLSQRLMTTMVSSVWLTRAHRTALS